jgi:hypothetical protein
MSAKRYTSPGAMIVLVTLSLAAAGCATTSSQNTQYKPRIITSEGVEEVGGFDLPDEIAIVLEFFDRLVPRPQEGTGISWR